MNKNYLALKEKYEKLMKYSQILETQNYVLKIIINQLVNNLKYVEFEI